MVLLSLSHSRRFFALVTTTPMADWTSWSIQHNILLHVALGIQFARHFFSKC